MKLRSQLIIVIISCSLCFAESVTKSDYRYISYRDLLTSVSQFSLEGLTSHSQTLFDVSRDQVFLGAKDGLYRLSLSDLKLLESVNWDAKPEKRRSCINKGQSEENCHNYIKILLTNGHQIFACGTNAFSPLCSWRNIDDLSNVTQWIDGIAKCPYNPAANVTGFLSESNEYFFGGTTDFSSSDYLISKNINGTSLLRTKQYNSFWLNDPQFVASFETSKFAYFLFKETAVEYINCGKIVYSRIARVCKSDQGGDTMLRDNWTTFIKARLNCSVSGDYPFYYNEIQSAQYIAEENMVYATFTTPSNSIAGSAVCAFNMSAIESAFDGPFKYQNAMNSAWTSHENPHRDHLNCKSTSHSHLMESSKYQLMDNAVQPTTLNPLYTEHLQRYTHIAVDVVNTTDQRVTVIYVAAENGFIKKLTLLPHQSFTCLVEVWQATSGPRNMIQNMQFLKDTNSIFVTTHNGLTSIPAGQCHRYSSEQSCLYSRDPYCGWNELVDKCTTAPKEDTFQKNWVQTLNKCPNPNMPINGGWSSWSEWQTCPQSSEKNGQCMCRIRECNNPAPAHGGKSCIESPVEVMNCTVHGGWTDWAYTKCSSTCGPGYRYKTRTCTNPKPAFGGRVCVGQSQAQDFCDNPECEAEPIHGGWSEWSSWSECTAKCGGFRFRKRECNNPVPEHDGRYCKGNDIVYESCNMCRSNKKSDTTAWITDYNASSFDYHQIRFKITCKAPVKHSQIKILIQDEEQNCHSNKCKMEAHSWSQWSSWSDCSAKCGRGIQSRIRHCLRDECIGPREDIRECNLRSCSEGYSAWSEWSSCTVSCFKTRQRQCLVPFCYGPNVEKAACSMEECENSLGWGKWSNWSTCDENDLQYRQRSCIVKNRGKHMCQGESKEERMCVGHTLTNEITADSIQASNYSSCALPSLGYFLFGFICGCLPFSIYLCYTNKKKRKTAVPSSPHYIREPNPYVTLPLRDKMQTKSYNGNGTIKSTKFDFSIVGSTLKRHSSELKNGQSKQNSDGDKHLYE